MYAIYSVINDYGISIILFTLIIKLLMFPTGYKQQKNMARTARIAPRLAQLRKNMAKNPQKLQEEQMKLYQEEGINPYAGCLPSIVTMIVLMGVWRVVQQPLTHILHLGGDAETAQSLLKTWLDSNGLHEKYLSSRPELVIMEYCKSNPEIFSSLSGFTDKVNSFDNSVLGLIDLGTQPTLSPDGGWTAAAVALAAIPFISGLVQLALTVYTQYKQKKTNPGSPSMGGMTAMLYIMPVFSVFMAFKLPAGVGFYWVINSLLSLLQTVALYSYFTAERTERIHEKEKAKASARNKNKRPGLYQRMLEQQQQMMAEQGGNNNGATNRVTYSDVDPEDLSRSELQELNRQRINAARKRMAEKYGEEVDKED